MCKFNSFCVVQFTHNLCIENRVYEQILNVIDLILDIQHTCFSNNKIKEVIEMEMSFSHIIIAYRTIFLVILSMTARQFPETRVHRKDFNS